MVLLQRGCYQLGWWRKLAIVKMLLSFENSTVANSKYSTRLIKLNYFKTWSSLFIFSKSLIPARLLFRSDYDSPQPRTSGIGARDNLIGSGSIGWMDLFLNGLCTRYLWMVLRVHALKDLPLTKPKHFVRHNDLMDGEKNECLAVLFCNLYSLRIYPLWIKQMYTESWPHWGDL